MAELQKYFADGIDHTLDEAVVAIKARLSEGIETALFLAFVLECSYRRLKMLHLPEEMSAEEKMTPVLSVESISVMTDMEVARAFSQLDALARAKFIIAMRRADGPSGKRFEFIIAKMGNSEAAVREQAKAAIVRRAQEEANRARKASEEAEAKRVRRDDEALDFIVQAPDGRFQTVAELDALIKDDEVFDWVNRRQIPVSDAMVVGKCLITDKKTAERLAEKLRRPKDKNRPLAFSIERTREWLAQCEKEREAARAREAEEAREAKARESAERGSFTDRVREAFGVAGTIPDKELVRNQLKTEAAAGEDWRFEVIREAASAREQELFEAIRRELRARFPHSSSFAELDVYIREMEAEFIGLASAECWTDNVVKGAEREVNIVRRHRQWLEDNPRGVVQPRPEADVINLAGRWESSSGRERPKFGPGSGIGGRKREKTQMELLIHRGRQIAFAEQKYWSNTIGKSVDMFSPEDFKRVVELFGDVRGDRKATKKKRGGN